MTATQQQAPSPELVEAWATSATAALELGWSLSEHEMSQPTDLPGWTVHDILAHLAALESELAGDEPILSGDDEIPPDALGNAFRAHTEKGVAARRGWSKEQMLDELEGAIGRLRYTLTGGEPGPIPADFPRPGTTWDALLRDRIIDFWMHEQDIRRAVDRPGGWDSPGAMVAREAFRSALPYIVGKKLRPDPGVTVRWVVHGPITTHKISVQMGTDGRARIVEDAAPDVRLEMSSETFVLLVGGRRSPGALDVAAEGDADLAAAVLPAMAITP